MKKISDAPSSSEIDLWALLQTLWQGKWIIVALTIIAGLIAVVLALTATEIFRAEALVQPRQETGRSGMLGGISTQFGGLADLAGLVGGGGGDRAVVIATLKSRTVIEGFIRDHNLLPRLYEPLWDPATKAWKNQNPKTMPTIWRAYNDFTRNIFRVTDDRKTGLCTVAIEWKDPAEAQKWVTELIARTNEYLKAKAVQEGERNLAYLEGQARKIGQVELQQALYGLVEVELRKLMLAKGGEEFALRTIDQAVVPTDRVRPKRKVMVLLGIVLGGLIGVMTVLARQSWAARGGHA